MLCCSWYQRQSARLRRRAAIRFGGDLVFALPHRAFQLRPAGSEDFQFAWSLFRDLMKSLTVEPLEWNEPGQKRVVELALAEKGTSIIVIDGLDAGWLQVSGSPDSIYLGQLYLAPSLQNRGIGTAVVRELRDKARQARKALTLRDEKQSCPFPLRASWVSGDWRI
jgi:GNAT superfamily N-acetyltransferase